MGSHPYGLSSIWVPGFTDLTLPDGFHNTTLSIKLILSAASRRLPQIVLRQGQTSVISAATSHLLPQTASVTLPHQSAAALDRHNPPRPRNHPSGRSLGWVPPARNGQAATCHCPVAPYSRPTTPVYHRSAQHHRAKARLAASFADHARSAFASALLRADHVGQRRHRADRCLPQAPASLCRQRASRQATKARGICHYSTFRSRRSPPRSCSQIPAGIPPDRPLPAWPDSALRAHEKP